MTLTRDKAGRFLKGQSGNPNGRPPRNKRLEDYAKQTPQRLRAMADDPETPAKTRFDIEKWIYETVYGKSAPGDETENVDIRALDLSKFSDEELMQMADEESD